MGCCNSSNKGEPKPPLNRNVWLVFIFSFTRSMFTSLFSSTPLAYYVLLTEDSNTAVGVVQGIQGIVNLFTAFPFSIIGDKYKRQVELRVGGTVWDGVGRWARWGGGAVGRWGGGAVGRWLQLIRYFYFITTRPCSASVA